jgi:cytoskeletal protein RodZ
MKNASGAEGQGQGERTKAELFFPSDGEFNTVVPLSQAGAAAAPSDISIPAAKPESRVEHERREEHERPEEQEETTLISARRGRGTRTAHAPRARRGGEQSWVFMAAVLFLSVAAGVAAGAYMIRSQRPAEAYRPPPPAAVDAPADAEVGKAIVTEPASETSTAQISEPAPESDGDTLTTEPEPAATSPVPAPPSEPVTKVERASVSAPPSKPAPKAAEPAERRVAEAEPRTARRVSATAGDASPAPRPTRAAAAPRRAERTTSVTVKTRVQPPLISTPPPSARSKKVIQWP